MAFNDFGLLVGKYLSALPTLANNDKSELLLDSSGRLIISGRFLEDSAHTSGDAGLHILAVRQDTAGSLVDTDGDYAPLQVDANGSLRIVGSIESNFEYAEDSAHTSGDIGSFMLAVRNDAETSLVDTNGDYAPLQVDADGRLKVATKVEVQPSDAEFAEDAAHTTGDTGLHMLAVRQDTLAASTDTDGDYSSLKVDSDGELYVTDVAARASLSAIETDAAAIETELLDQGTTLDSIETEIQSITHAEDVAHTSGDSGVMSLAVRADADGTLADTDGDYAPLQVNADGKLKVVSEEATEGTEAFSTADALAAGADGLIAVTGTFTDVATLDISGVTTAFIYGWQFDCDVNAVARLIVDDGVNITVYKTRVNSSAMPGIDEHWSKDGRIEISGGGTTTVKVQVRARQASSGNASASMYIRTV